PAGTARLLRAAPPVRELTARRRSAGEPSRRTGVPAAGARPVRGLTGAAGKLRVMAALPLDLPLEYVRLGLRFDRLESGFVDAYTGDPRLRAEVAAEPAPTPSGLRDQARMLLRELDAADLAADRTEYLRGQLTGLECTARKMNGEPVGFVDEVAAYFQVDVVLGDPAEDAAAPARLGALLSGDGTLAERYATPRRREECPPDRLESAVHALSSALR